MTPPQRLIAITLALVAAALVSTAGVSAQNLFEVQVFPDENAGRGETQIEFHNVVIPSGTLLGDNMRDPTMHVHLSVEVTHGWTEAFETGFLVETAPVGSDRHATLTGWHFHPKFRLGAWHHMPFHLSLSGEYTFVKQPGDRDFREAIAITPILERHARRFEMSFNPALEIAVKGPGTGASPIFEPSAKAASKIDLRTSSGWDLNVGVGRGLTGGSEHWVVKSIVGLRLPR